MQDVVRSNEEFFRRYLKLAPLPLAVERTYECDILSRQKFERPILDVGTGDGIFASVLFRNQVDLGVDPNADEVAVAKNFDIYKDLLVTSGGSIPKPSNFFNTVFSNSVLEHIEGLDSVLEEIHRVLSPSGVFYATVPTDKFEKFTLIYQTLYGLGLHQLAENYSKFFNRFWRHFHAHSPQGWQKYFESKGFRVVQMQEYAPKTMCVMNDTLAPFSLVSFVTKKTLNRWFLVPAIRAVTAHAFAAVFTPLTKIKTKPGEGGIVFFALSKNLPS